MMKSVARRGATMALALTLTAPAMGASPTSRADKTAKNMLKMENALKEGAAQLDSIIASLNSLSSAQGSDLVSRYTEYSKLVEEMNSAAKKVKSKAEKAKSQREDYLKAWKKDQDKIQNEQLKQASEARRAELEPVIRQISEGLTTANQNFTPLLQNLNDLNLFLGNDLSAHGLTTARDLISQCNKSAEIVKEDVEKANEGLRNLAARITPGGTSK